jgi:hypothetical protein
MEIGICSVIKLHFIDAGVEKVQVSVKFEETLGNTVFIYLDGIRKNVETIR